MNFKDFFQKIILESADKFQWVHHSDVPYLKFNPNQYHNDPAGYYFFPIDFKPVTSWVAKPYKFYANVSPSAKILDFSEISSDEIVDIAKKAKIANKLKNDIASHPVKNNEDLMDRLWDLMRNNTFTGKPAAFNTFFRKLGYDAILDKTNSVHSMEHQLIVLNPRIITAIEMDKPRLKPFIHLEKVVKIITELLSAYGNVKADKPQKGRVYSAPALLSKIEVTNGDKYATFNVSYDLLRNLNKEIYVSLAYSNPSLGYGVGTTYSIVSGEFLYDDYEKRLKRDMDKIFKAPLKESMNSNIKLQQNDNYHTSDGQDSRFWGNRGAGVIIKSTRTGRYLLGLRSQFVNEPNTWNLFGGKIDDGEDPKEAVLRELKEEIGFKKSLDIKLFDTFKNKSFTFYNFYGEVDDEFRPTLNWEHSDARWFALDELPPNLHFGLKRLVSKLK